MSIVVTRYKGRGEVEEYLNKMKTAGDARTGLDMNHTHEPGIGDDAVIGYSLDSLHSLPTSKNPSERDRVDSLIFRRYNASVELRRVQDSGASSGESDSILREMAFVIDAYLEKS
ncbi:hypothetical protein [Streptomyces sp. A1-5]|uniref:hypothetical protein n=1 Tax=Streptomyces sp. A1-5 TaxID=2738410 RepID=UPI001F371164|nr:hypothetical protein [Streptomyces sp. A1-5]UJB40745.1 hypothetical protein HRD51_07835 [Streptomyces sp. A1-5]